MELSQFKEPIEQELHAQELSEIIKISSTSILESLQKIIKNKKNHNKKKLIQNDSILQNDNNYSLIEEDLIRLCFSDKFQIRNYLFEHVNTKWIKSNLINNIYDKIYIHLHSKNYLNIELIMSELTKKEQKNKLAEILFDLEKNDLNINVAKDCIAQLEKKWINDQLEILRESLKESVSNKNKSYSIMQKITELQTQKQNIHN
tara:strand:- start:790 stop:1398 length:609 start_codon:yes stop_codon:yes gene_type:complete